MADQPYTYVQSKSDLVSAIQAALLRRMAKEVGRRPEDLTGPEVHRFEAYAGYAMMAALDWLAAAGRLLPEGASPAPCGCPVDVQPCWIVRHTRECGNKAAADRLAAHIAEEYGNADD